ncbi:hypothetical protein L596_009835 [Steinernema carpocapsae]|uniref:SH3 domain-containing protein n=1 Tax=Steinernema carpocapsae TaxID=34508 RepID=A0A4U5PH06_STECR|nr:hypothetical protein L596_009835 [Steinernema carpocapsae]
MGYLENVTQSMGVVYDGKVFASYDYDAESEDELSFVAGDVLRVTKRDNADLMWWECEHLETHNTGLVPSNYLSLYPSHAQKIRLGFQHFELVNASGDAQKEQNNNDASFTELA